MWRNGQRKTPTRGHGRGSLPSALTEAFTGRGRHRPACAFTTTAEKADYRRWVLATSPLERVRKRTDGLDGSVDPRYQRGGRPNK